MATQFRSQDRSAQTPYQETTSATGLRADRTDISFHNLSPDVVRVEVQVTNEGCLRSPPTEVVLQSAPLGAFLPWQPLLTLTVPSLAPRTSTVVSGSAWVPQPAPVVGPENGWELSPA